MNQLFHFQLNIIKIQSYNAPLLFLGLILRLNRGNVYNITLQKEEIGF